MKRTTELMTVLLLLLITVPAIAMTYGQSASTNSAQDATYSAYKAILKASNAGADTNQLIQQLNQAINLTAQAQQLNSTNPQRAQSLVDQAQIIAQNVTQQAIAAQQSASNVLPIIAVASAVSLILAGILVYAFGPKLLWRIWFNLRKNYRIKTKNPLANNKSLIITAEQLCAIFLGITIIIAFFSVSLFVLPRKSR